LLLKYDHYYLYAELTAALQQLAAANPQLAKLASIGTTPEGRELWLMTITDGSSGDADHKPAYLIDGNHHAGEVTGSMVALYAIDELLTRSREPAFIELLQRYTFYILPRLSPDGAELYLTTPASLRSVPRAYPFAEPLPGLTPQDINGDGKISLMRVATPLGTWRIDPADNRRMLKRLPDEEGGEYYAIYQEGMIHEYDGYSFEQAPSLWGMDLNRNYPEEWGIESKQGGAGPYPLSEPETRALAEFVMSHPNIGGVSTLHTTGGVILRPPSTKPERQSDQGDMRIFKEIGAMATDETGYPCIHCYDGYLADPTGAPMSGAFDDWLYAHLGIPGYTVELWDLGSRAGVKMWPRKDKSDSEQSDDFAKVLTWLDKEMQGVGFIPWHSWEHPQLGKVEIGGFDSKLLSTNCPVHLLEQECQKTTRFFYRHVKALPRLQLTVPQVDKVGANSYRVSVEVSNLGYLATYLTQMGKQTQAVKPSFVEIIGGELLLGERRVQLPQLEGRAAVGGSFEAGRYRSGANAAQQKKISWLIRGVANQELTLKLFSPKGGMQEVSITLPA